MNNDSLQFSEVWNNCELLMSVWLSKPCFCIDDCPGLNIKFQFYNFQCYVGYFNYEEFLNISNLFIDGNERDIEVVCNPEYPDDSQEKVIFSLKSDSLVATVTIQCNVGFKFNIDCQTLCSLGKHIEKWANAWEASRSVYFATT